MMSRGSVEVESALDRCRLTVRGNERHITVSLNRECVGSLAEELSEVFNNMEPAHACAVAEEESVANGDSAIGRDDQDHCLGSEHEDGHRGAQAHPDCEERSLGKGRSIYGVDLQLTDEANGYLILFVVPADTREDAMAKVLLKERRDAKHVGAEYLGIEGSDELAHAEDEWAMGFFKEKLFGDRGVIGLGEA